MMKRLGTILFAGMMCVSLAACGASSSQTIIDAAKSHQRLPAAGVDERALREEQDVETDAPAETVAAKKADTSDRPTFEQKDVYKVGEPWVVEDAFSLTILGVDVYEDRNPYSDKNPEAVYKVDYVYTNDGYSNTSSDGLYLYIDQNIVDADGEKGYSYPGETVYYSRSIPVGAGCRATDFIGVNHAGVCTITMKVYMEGDVLEATFEIDPEAAAVSQPIQPLGVDPAGALKMGETWTVDGQWELTITGVREVDERNDHSQYNPAAVYVVDYTYKNLGYEDSNGIMDGLFMNPTDVVIDAAGMTGYAYPGKREYYPKEIPIGDTCQAQAVIGVDHPGNFFLKYDSYDGNKEEQTKLFYIEVE